MRARLRRLASACAALLLSVTVLTTAACAWEKEQQALNNVLEQDDTVYTPVTVKLPVITKRVEGKHAPKERFTFVLKGKNGAPMPEEASGSRYAVSRVDRGSVPLGSITYEKPGTYLYTVYEVEGSDLNWTYDDTEYTITVTVEKDGDRLTARSTIQKNGKQVSKLTFTNVYEEIDLDETVTISGQKTWNHGKNPESNQPDHIIVMVYADGVLTQQKNVTERSDWKYSFVLPKYTKTGEEIRYAVDEADVTDYSKKIRGYDITNTYTGTGVPERPEDPVQPDQPTDPADPTNPTDPSKPGADPQPGTDSRPGTDSKPKPSPKTGDEFPLTLWLVLGAVGLSGFVVMLVLLFKTRNTYQGKRLKKKGKRLKRK